MTEYRDCEQADILLVEDNPGDVGLTEEAFKEGQISNTLHVVEDGIEALDFLFQRDEYTDAPARISFFSILISHGKTVMKFSRRCETIPISGPLQSSY